LIKKLLTNLAMILILFLITTNVTFAKGDEEAGLLEVKEEPILQIPDEFPKQFAYDSGYDFPYPQDGVKGIYVTGHSAGGSHMEKLVDFIN